MDSSKSVTVPEKYVQLAARLHLQRYYSVAVGNVVIMVVVMIVAMWRKFLFFKVDELLVLFNGVLHEQNLLLYCFLC